MSEQLSPFKIKYGRRVFNSYSAVNSFSFALVTGNTITLYALALGASGTVVGLLSACMYLSFFAIPFGSRGVRKRGLVKTFARNWMLRNWSLIPLLAMPFLYAHGHSDWAIILLLFSVLFFNFFRGVGLIANNPVIGLLAPGKDRGEYIVRLSLINNGTALLATMLLALLLWHSSGIETYNLVILIGIITGIVASALLFKLPEGRHVPDVSPVGQTEASSLSFFGSLRQASRDRNFVRFIASYLVIGLGIGMARPFIVVYCKEVYGQSDGIVTFFTICSTLGALLMGAVMRLAIDRLGARPMYIIYTFVSLASLVPAVLSPGIHHAFFPIVFLALLSAVTNMGFAGQESAAQTYFFAMVPRDAIMNLSMVYYFILGITGAVGSILGGTLLDGLLSVGLSPAFAFRLFFLAAIVVIAVGIQVQRRLLDMGSYPVKDTLAALFSPRDMRALTLLRRLDVNEDPDEETEILAELGEVASELSCRELLAHLSSPRFAVRYEALQSLSSLERLSGPLEDALIGELSSGIFSTAALSARLCGEFRLSRAIPLLREALSSADYRLSGEAMLALARLGDSRSQFAIGDILLASTNPFILVRGVQAMEVFGSTASIPILLDLLRNELLPAHIADETILALSTLMGVPRRFYYAYESYVTDRSKAADLVSDALEEAFARCKKEDMALRAVITSFISDSSADSPFVRWVLDFGQGHTGVYAALLVGVALDADLNRLEPFRFFLCFWAASAFRDRKLIEK